MLVLGTAACGAQDSGTDGTVGAEATPHGYVEGASEADEPQLRLAVSDEAAGTLTLVDLLSGETVTTMDAGPLTGSDQRYLFTGAAAGTTVTDSGVWTVDHGDHRHYYRSQPSILGEIPGRQPGHVGSADARIAVVDDAAGQVTVIPRSGVDRGGLEPAATVTVGAHHGVAVPFADHVVTTLAPDAADEADAADAELPDTLAVFDAQGARSGLVGDDTCPHIHGATTVRGAALFACEDGVLVVTQAVAADTSGLNSRLIPYPQDAAGRTWSLSAGRDLVAMAFEDGGLGLLDPRTGGWTVTPTRAALTAVALAGDDRTVLALDEEGTGYAVDPGTGGLLGERELIAGDRDGASVVLGTERGYVSDPSSGTVFELDVADGLRQARSFPLGGTPGALALTGGR